MTESITITNYEAEAERVQAWQNASRQLYRAAETGLALSALRGMCLLVREHYLDAGFIVLEQSDQGDYATLSEVRTFAGQPIERDERYDEMDDQAYDFVYDLTPMNWQVWATPETLVEGSVTERQGINVTLDIDKCLELAQVPALLPNEIEVHTLAVDGYDNPVAVMAFGTERESWDALRERYVDGGGRRNLTDQEVIDYLTDDPGGFAVYMDSSIFTIPKEA